MNPRALLEKLDRAAVALQSPVLLIVRLYWGIAFAQTGFGKLMNLDRTAGFFDSLGIPLPHLNAIAAGATEFFGGVLLALGLFARPAALPLIFTMAVAYGTAHREELGQILSNPDQFTGADPFLFLLASVIVLAFGPGRWSADAVIARSSKPPA
jgi:putative oxidoreductase